MKIKIYITSLVILLSSLFLFGCLPHLERVHGKGVLYIHKELVEADRAIDNARLSGADKECPEEFKEVQALRDEAYRLYWECLNDEAIAKAKEAIDKAKALCPEPVVTETLPPETVTVTEVAQAPPASLKYEREKVTTIVLEDVTFEFDSYTLTDNAKIILDRHIQTLKENSESRVIIEGHSCAHGTDEYNLALSEKRAIFVRDYLIKKGISAYRLKTIGYGEAQLLMPEIPTPTNKDSLEARSNRRVHLIVEY